MPPPPPGNAEKIATLRNIIARLPEQGIPEFKLLSEGDWHLAVDDGLDTPEDVRRALGRLRTAAEHRFAKAVQPALRDYIKASGGIFPSDPMQLQSYAPREIEPAMLQRYRVAAASEVPTIGVEGHWMITQRHIIDPDYHTTFVISSDGLGSTSTPPATLRDLAILEPLKKAYQAARGEYPRDVEQLLPYAGTPEQQAAIYSLKKAQDKAQGKTPAR